MDNLQIIAQLFSERLFLIPDYQRGYAWEEQQCQDFIEDLELLPEGKQHFSAHWSSGNTIIRLQRWLTGVVGPTPATTSLMGSSG